MIRCTHASPKRAVSILLCVLCGHVGVVAAGEALIYANSGITYDSNLFRLSDARDTAALLGTEKRSDTYYNIGLGVDAWSTLSQQRLSLRAGVDENRFQRFSYLNYQGGNALAAWDWRIAPAFSGNLSHTYKRSLPGFTDAQDGTRDVLTTQLTSFIGDYHLLPRWRVRTGLTRQDVDHSAARRGQLNSETDTQEFGLRYVSRRENAVGLYSRTRETHYAQPETIAAIVVNNDYRDKEWGMSVDWRYSGLSQLQLAIARTQREHVTLPERDYSGSTGRITYHFYPTGKLGIATTLSRELSGQSDVVASYVVTDSVGVSPTWSLTAKTRIQGTATFQERDYRGDPNVSLGTAAERKDRTRMLGITGLYSPLANIDTTIGYQQGTRKSTAEFGDYRYHSVVATLMLAF